MNTFIEPLIIFMVLYFPGLYFSLASLFSHVPAVVSFNVNEELARIIVYNLPALGLIWYFLLKEPLRSVLGRLKPAKNDFFPAIQVFLGLVVIGIITSNLMYLVSQTKPEGMYITGLFSWIIIILSCIVTGYAEESYFRIYLLNYATLSGISPKKAIMVSLILFTVCHAYQGIIGLLTSGLAGLFLSFIYMKKKSIHGIAIGHGFYNIMSYVFAHFASFSS
jgi:membrane protease YdiL (CAAX protease family)